MTTAPTTVTLVSNSNMDKYPNNKGSDFTVKLANPLRFNGLTWNDDSTWEVALTSMQYTNRFYNIPERITVRVMVQYLMGSYIDTSKPAVKNTFIFPSTYNGDQMVAFLRDRQSSATVSEGVFEGVDARVVLNHTRVANSRHHIGCNVVLGKVWIPAGHYKNAMAVCDVFVQKLNELFDTPRYKTRFAAEMYKDNGTMRFVTDPDLTMDIYTNKSILGTALGMRCVKTPETGLDNSLIFRMIHQLPHHPPRVEVVQSLYVYTDIIKYQHVGDVMVPLMEVIPVQGMPGDRILYPLNPLTYLPVDRSYIEAINIKICDEKGMPVNFPDDEESVVCRLHFRPVAGSNNRLW